MARAATGYTWQHLEFMVADLLDNQHRARVDFVNANRDEKAPMQPYPDPVWRPEKPEAAKKRRRQDRMEAAEARSGYLRIVAQVTPEYAEKG
ncbi:hypothetical protein [Streptomyces parvulus]|uniref:hypothetical protein n=1 Tax=Streptomyces parvulus TaxID=146923 RepID=UPI0037B7F486